jgi:hypothetical protein
VPDVGRPSRAATGRPLRDPVWLVLRFSTMAKTMPTSPWWVLAWAGPLVALLLVTIPIVIWSNRRGESRAAQREQGVIAPREACELHLDLPPRTAVALARAAMSDLRLRYGTSVQESDDGSTLSCTTPLSLWSLGQHVEVQVTGETDSSLVLRSWPSAWWAITDWGEGRRLVRGLAADIQRRASEEVPGLAGPC